MIHSQRRNEKRKSLNITSSRQRHASALSSVSARTGAAPSGEPQSRIIENISIPKPQVRLKKRLGRKLVLEERLC
jgi:hypothetical protein